MEKSEIQKIQKEQQEKQKKYKDILEAFANGTETDVEKVEKAIKDERDWKKFKFILLQDLILDGLHTLDIVDEVWGAEDIEDLEEICEVQYDGVENVVQMFIDNNFWYY